MTKQINELTNENICARLLHAVAASLRSARRSFFALLMRSYLGLVTFPRSVHDELAVQVKKVASVHLVVRPAPPISLLLRDELPYVLLNEIIFLDCLLGEKTPAGSLNPAFRHEEMLVPPHRNVVVPATLRNGWRNVPWASTSAAIMAEVGIALSLAGVARASVRPAHAVLAPAAWKEVGTLVTPHAMLRAKVHLLDA